MRDVNAKAQADEKGSGRDRGSNDFLNAFYKVTRRHTGLGDATPQKNGLNKCLKQCFKQRGSDRDRGSHDFIKHV